VNLDPQILDTVRGDTTGFLIPAHGEALRACGAAFLTEAFHTFGSLPKDNRVTRIARIEECRGGSTGSKVFLTVEYEKPDPNLHTEMFVKFSRNIHEPIKDVMRHELESETRFAAVTRLPGFPIRVPVAYFGDYHHESGTGLVITERIYFGKNGVEPHHQKYMDFELDDPLPYYRQIIKSLARLAAAHKSGRLSTDIDQRFPYDPERAAAADPIPVNAEKLRGLLAKYADLAAACPRLFPDNIRSPDFIAKVDREIGRFLEHEKAIKRWLQSDREYIALCHWNGHIDNGWFWRDAAGELHCGLLDWGRVGQLNVAFAIWGCLSGAPTEIWDRHYDDLVTLFADELHAHGGPRLDPARLKLMMDLYVALMNLAWVMRVPTQLPAVAPNLAEATGPEDPIVAGNEKARYLLNTYIVFLYAWRLHDFGACIDRFLEIRA
jgi:hypothetical protein